MNDYFVVRLSNVSDQAEEWLSHAAFAAGASGMSEKLDFHQPEGEEDVQAVIPSERCLEIYFSDRPAAEFLDQVRAHFPEIHLGVSLEAERDWLAEWKKSFQPFPLAGGFWVVPSWCETPKAARTPIAIDPGMAFGTGTHETTRLVAEELVKLGPMDSLLDVGTGTGILAILAYKMGYSRVDATEIEQEARRVAHENFALNKVQVGLDVRQVENLNAVYDIVVANIIDGVLVRIQDSLKSRVKPGGWLVVSGIIKEREPDFLAGFRLPPGKSWSVRREMGDWLLFAVQL